MRIIPVMDLMAGQVVHAIAGRREEYQAVQSQLAPTADPVQIARALVEQYGFDMAYVADLDAIAGAPLAWEQYGRIAGCGLSLWLDAGLTDTPLAEEMLAVLRSGAPINTLIAGLEGLRSPFTLEDLLGVVGSPWLTFSLDLRQGRPLVPELCNGWLNLDARQIVTRAVELGTERFILLDLATVGTGSGVSTLELCRWMRDEFADKNLQITAGGGVRHLKDVRQLHEAGCDAALVATAIHRGTLTPDDVTEAASWV